MGRPRKTEEDYRQLAAQHALNWVGKFPPTVLDKTLWECEYGHRYMSKYNTIQQNGSSCPKCAVIKRRLKPRRYHDLASKRNAAWIGESPKDTHQKTLWECKECEHCWHASYNYLLYDSSGCPKCAKEKWLSKYRLDTNDYLKLGYERGLVWHGPLVPNVHTKTMWEGECSHHWMATYQSIKKGTGCSICNYGERRHTPNDYVELGEKASLGWVGGPNVPRNVHIKTKWRCNQGHIFESSYNNILHDQGCPLCIDRVNGYQVSDSQRQLCEMVGGELNHPFGRKRIDIALPDEKIAIEYDSWFWHGGRLENDKERDKELLDAGWRILHVRSNTELPTKNQLDNATTRLRLGEKSTEIVLDDWGYGPVFTGFM